MCLCLTPQPWPICQQVMIEHLHPPKDPGLGVAGSEAWGNPSLPGHTAGGRARGTLPAGRSLPVPPGLRRLTGASSPAEPGPRAPGWGREVAPTAGGRALSRVCSAVCPAFPSLLPPARCAGLASGWRIVSTVRRGSCLCCKSKMRFYILNKKKRVLEHLQLGDSRSWKRHLSR